MNKMLLAIGTVWIFIGKLDAQSNSRFPIDPQTKWKISEISYAPDYNMEVIREKYEYFIESDTIINSRPYYKLYKSGISYYDTPFYYERVYAGAIRDDNNNFFLIRKDEDTEVMLFDYDLELGDTIRAEIGKGQIINRVNTLTDGRKVISSVPEICGGCCATITLLEGIGHSGGIMEDPPCFHIGYYGHYLNCFETNGELIYQNEMSLVDCDHFLTAVETLKDNPEVNIYPVPATSRLSIELPAMHKVPSTISILNISGSVVMTCELFSGITEIDIGNLKEGIYAAKITDQMSCSFKKILVIQ
ncbi:MAG: T9SS type A sorting domain-containing protein [Bacteroidales bacterium]|nr:T9SS type A sorting domain-containing protein [Bacteroidales bacterium]